jgi:hypothetical protein
MDRIAKPFALLALCWFSTAAPAQWIDYPTLGIPRLPDGSPDFDAPTPRTRFGVPDLSGIWWAAERRADQCEGELDCIVQMDLPADQIDIGRTLPDGLPYQRWAEELVAGRTARQAQDDPHARCLPPNFPRAYSFPQYFKIVQTEGLIVILHEFNASFRQIFLDGRPLPEDPNPSWNGYSTAYWDGETLVVESIGFRDDLWLDMAGNPLTETARVTERIRRPKFGELEVELTIDDARAYEEPWTVTLRHEAIVDTELLEEICLENEQDVRLFEEAE